jgi:hypothetical protein
MMDWLTTLTVQQALTGVAALVALGAGAWLSIYAQGPVDRYLDVDSIIDDQQLAAADQPRRHVRAGPPQIQGPDGLAVPAPLPPQRCAAIARLARAMAASDFGKHGRPSANPYSRHTRQHVIYAIEYEAHWDELSTSASPPSGAAQGHAS